MRVLLAAVVGAMLHAAGAAAQDAPRGGNINGTVTDAETGRPLPRALVSATNRNGTWAVLSDERGWFEFFDYVAGPYKVSAAKTGYVKADYGTADGRPTYIDLRAGQTYSKVAIALQRAAVIAVTVTDEFGAPLEGASVMVQQPEESRGHLVFGQIYDRHWIQTTDDLGQARIYNLPAGSYYVSASRPSNPFRAGPPDAPGTASLTTFYPGAIDADGATPVSVETAAEAAIVIPVTPTPVARVTGRVVLDGSTVSSPSVSITRLTPFRFTPPPKGSLVEGDVFVFSNVLPGEYLLEYFTVLRKPDANAYGALRITVANTDLEDLVIVAGPAARISGRVVPDEPDAELDWGVNAHFSVKLETDAGWPYTIQPKRDGSFVLDGLTGRGLGWRGNGFGWYLKAVMHDGKDITDRALDFAPGAVFDDVRIIVTRAHTEVTGSVRDAARAPLSEFTVVVFPEDPALAMHASRYVDSARTEDGRFSLKGLPPGRYLAIAIDGPLPRDLFAPGPGGLEGLRPHAAPLTLELGRSTVVSVPLLAH